MTCSCSYTQIPYFFSIVSKYSKPSYYFRYQNYWKFVIFSVLTFLNLHLYGLEEQSFYLIEDSLLSTINYGQICYFLFISILVLILNHHESSFLIHRHDGTFFLLLITALQFFQQKLAISSGIIVDIFNFH